MRKFIAIILMITTVFSAIPVFAECPTHMPQSVTVTVEKSECKSMFIVDENRELSGIKNMREANTRLNFNVFEYGTNIRGILSDGTVLRSRGLAQLEKVNDYWFGLTPFDVEVELLDGYEELVASIVKSRVDADTLTSPAIVASTLWLKDTYAGHIFYTEFTRRVHVGYVHFIEQNCSANLWAGDIDGDDELELGFIAGTWHAPDPVVPKEDPSTNTTITTTTVTTSNKCNKSTTTVQSGCGTTVVNTGNGNNITTTSTKVNGDNNTTTTTNNTTNSITLFGVTINKNVNTTTTNVTKTILRPSLTMMRDSIGSPGKCC